jgi:regulator of replication initiation timing
MDKTNIIYQNVVELIKEESGALAALTLNPNLSWIKFILLDDQPNGNKQRVPQSEFDNIIRTGIHMPIKVSEGQVSLGHKGSTPIGVITDLIKEGNKIKGLAALWETERGEDIKNLKQSFEAGIPLNLSWELDYTEKTLVENITDLLGVSLNAATFVGLPAYGGRTPVVAMASKWSNDYVETLPDSSFIFINKDYRLCPYIDKDGFIDKESLSAYAQDTLAITIDGKTIGDEIKVSIIEKARSLLIEEEHKLEELEKVQASLEEANTKLSELQTTVDEKTVENTTLTSELAQLKTELEDLKTFKNSIENEKLANEKFASIKNLFSEAGITVDDIYFEERKETLMSMDETALKFFVQEVASFNKEEKTSSAGLQVPPLSSGKTVIENPKTLAKKLLEMENRGEIK